MAQWDNCPMRTLLVAGAGGHLEELVALRPRLVGISDEVTWVTSDTPQSRSLLDGEERIFIPRAMPHDVKATIATTRRALNVVKKGKWDQVVSTGSLPAVPFLTIGRARGMGCHFIESAARVHGPSLAARILKRVPGVHRYRQFDWGRGNWAYRGSVFDGFVSTEVPEAPIRRIVVTVGVNGYGFPRLVEAVRSVAPEGAEIFWQTGTTDVSSMGIDGVAAVETEDLRTVMGQADVVIAHGGVGSALMAMQAGRCPILIPRERMHREHVDDHQREIATRLAATGLALTCAPGDLDADLLAEAARRRIVRDDSASPFVLS